MQNNIAIVRVRDDMIAANAVVSLEIYNFFCETIASNASLGLKIISRPGEHILPAADIGPTSGGRALLRKS